MTRTSFTFNHLMVKVKHLYFNLAILGVPTPVEHSLKLLFVKVGQNSLPKHKFLVDFKDYSIVNN